MHRRSDIVGISLICLYILGCMVWLSSLRSSDPSKYKPQVLSASATSEANLTEQSNLPNMKALHEYINTKRNREGLGPLQADSYLVTLAQSRANDMAERNYYAHQNPDGHFYYEMINDDRFKSNFSCENLALDSATTVQTFLDQWLVSTKGHKECLLNPKITHAGYGTAVIKNAYVVVAVYASSR